MIIISLKFPISEVYFVLTIQYIFIQLDALEVMRSEMFVALFVKVQSSGVYHVIGEYKLFEIPAISIFGVLYPKPEHSNLS